MRVWMACLLAGLAACGPALASDERDHDRARRAVEEGRMLPLRDIMARAQATYPGQVVEAELEDEKQTPVYEIKIVTDSGRVVKLRYDARTGELLTTSERNGRR
ncbi:MAG: PepSY domain-containing protein [Proteobacteria bacterium]|nr:PepSY domain-containing protein [Pseudomonadota bacterium]